MDIECDLSGTWSGHYVQRDVAHAITAEFHQHGECVTGTMCDADVQHESSLFEAAIEAGLPPGADEQIADRLRSLFPGAAQGPIRYEVQFPSESVVTGTVRGGVLTFLKTYKGQYFAGYRVGERRVGRVIEQHVVHYQGHINDLGDLIQGQWWIDAEPSQGVGRADGSFVLRRL